MTESSSAVDLSSIDVKGAVESMYVPKEDRVLDPSKADASLLERMPSPTGWRMLILPYRGKGKTAGGVYLPEKVVDDGQLTTVVGYVMKQGPLCYKDEAKFPDGPWCKTGDWVIFARYAGSRFRIEGGEVRPRLPVGLVDELVGDLQLVEHETDEAAARDEGVVVEDEHGSLRGDGRPPRRRHAPARAIRAVRSMARDGFWND